MKLHHAVCVLTLCATVLAGCRTPESVGAIVQDDAHTPLPWRALTAQEATVFDLGHAVFNTQWARVDDPPGRRDGLGPLFNAASCYACHNSRRRGRGPRQEGAAPADLVIQLGRRSPDGSVQRGVDSYGHILNTSAMPGFAPEAAVSIRYDELVRALRDGVMVSLRVPRYEISQLSGGALPASTVLMPRMPPSVQGVGLLELVPQSELIASSTRGQVSRLEDGAIGRFGWQATEASVASQTAAAFSREMGLSTPLIAHIDCGREHGACLNAATGGDPEVERQLFDALVLFQQAHAVPLVKPGNAKQHGGRLFTQLGCAECHRLALPVEIGQGKRGAIHAFTDLLLHDLGAELADRNLAGDPVRSLWRTAPLWGRQASIDSGQPLRLLHDGRARSIEEAILWHSGEAQNARQRYERLSSDERRALAAWIATL